MRCTENKGMWCKIKTKWLMSFIFTVLDCTFTHHVQQWLDLRESEELIIVCFLQTVFYMFYLCHFSYLVSTRDSATCPPGDCSHFPSTSVSHTVTNSTLKEVVLHSFLPLLQTTDTHIYNRKKCLTAGSFLLSESRHATQCLRRCSRVNYCVL